MSRVVDVVCMLEMHAKHTCQRQGRSLVGMQKGKGSGRWFGREGRNQGK